MKSPPCSSMIFPANSTSFYGGCSCQPVLHLLHHLLPSGLRLHIRGQTVPDRTTQSSGRGTPSAPPTCPTRWCPPAMFGHHIPNMAIKHGNGKLIKMVQNACVQISNMKEDIQNVGHWRQACMNVVMKGPGSLSAAIPCLWVIKIHYGKSLVDHWYILVQKRADCCDKNISNLGVQPTNNGNYHKSMEVWKWSLYGT